MEMGLHSQPVFQCMGAGKRCALLAPQGYKAQADMVLTHLERLLSSCMACNESVLVEGVHLSLNAVMRLMARHPAIVPFLVHIRHDYIPRPVCSAFCTAMF